MEKIKEFIKKLELKRVFKKFLIWFLLITFLEFIFAFIMHDNYTKESCIVHSKCVWWDVMLNLVQHLNTDRF